MSTGESRQRVVLLRQRPPLEGTPIQTPGGSPGTDKIPRLTRLPFPLVLGFGLAIPALTAHALLLCIHVVSICSFIFPRVSRVRGVISCDSSPVCYRLYGHSLKEIGSHPEWLLLGQPRTCRDSPVLTEISEAILSDGIHECTPAPARTQSQTKYPCAPGISRCATAREHKAGGTRDCSFGSRA